MEMQKIQQLAELINNFELDELEFREQDTYILLKKRRNPASVAPADISPNANISEQVMVAAPVQPAITQTAQTVEEESGDTVTSPMVGTFYRASAPDAAPFVEKGSAVKSGDILCIIEAMKMMNRVKAERSGVVQEILVNDAQPVEFGQKLFLIA